MKATRQDNDPNFRLYNSRLLRLRASVNVPCGGDTPLHMALRFPVFDIVEPLVGCRPVWKPNSIQLYKASDLQIFRGGSLHMVQSLLTHGKSENTADEKRHAMFRRSFRTIELHILQ